MGYFLYFSFLFFIGSTIGYILELFFRRIVHKKWVNPGFLVGPYLPIYGFGLCTLTFLYAALTKTNINPIIIIFMMGLCMTLIELIAGIIFIRIGGVKLWDYSNVKYNFKGIICLRFSIIWTIMSAFYYCFIGKEVLNALIWFDNNISFSFVLGLFFGIIIIDYIYSTNIMVKIREFAKENHFIVKYEEFKKYIKEFQERNNEKYSFIFPFKQSKNLKDYLVLYRKSINNKGKRFILNLLGKNK